MPFSITHLKHRKIIHLKGPDKRSFLQGLITQDVNDITSKKAIYAALLNPQGRFLYDLLISEDEEGEWLIDCEHPEELIKRLMLFKLRSHIELTYRKDWKVYALWNKGQIDLPPQFMGGNSFVDPRTSQLGYRWYSSEAFADHNLLPLESYDKHRILLGIPDGGRDIPLQKGIILEYNFNELNGVSWKKGCYIGQELIARTHHVGAVRKRLLPIIIEGLKPEIDTFFYDENDQEIGLMRTSVNQYGLALLRLDMIKEKNLIPLNNGQTAIKPLIPEWFNLSNKK